MNDTKLKKMADGGDKRAARLIALTDQPAKFLSTIQVAITLASLMQSAFAAENFAGPLVKWLIDMGVNVPEEGEQLTFEWNNLLITVHDVKNHIVQNTTVEIKAPVQ